MYDFMLASFEEKGSNAQKQKYNDLWQIMQNDLRQGNLTMAEFNQCH